MKTRIASSAVLIFLAGCAPPYSVPPLESDHPASPLAREAPASEPPAAPTAAPSSPTAKPAPKIGGHAHHHGHGGHP